MCCALPFLVLANLSSSLPIVSLSMCKPIQAPASCIPWSLLISPYWVRSTDPRSYVCRHASLHQHTSTYTCVNTYMTCLLQQHTSGRRHASQTPQQSLACPHLAQLLRRHVSCTNTCSKTRTVHLIVTTIDFHICGLIVQNTEEFCREVLTSPELVGYANAQYVCWGGDISAPDAYMVRACA